MVCASLDSNGSRVVSDLEALRAFSDVPAPAVQRILYTEADVAARSFLRRLFEAEGLQVREDPIGNIFARWKGSEENVGTVGTGSHYDAIPYSGMYDGTLGVIGAVEAIRALKRSGFQPQRSIEILAFTSEEPTRFGLGCIGSRALVGAIRPTELKALRDENGTSFEEARHAAGYTAPLDDNLELDKDYYSAFIELHIEQGPDLEATETDLGIVTAIAAPAQLIVDFEGDGGHAGALLMHRRNDALLAGAELALFVEAAALQTKSEDTVATTGTLSVTPGAVNSVPRGTKLGIDIRDSDLARRNAVLDEILTAVPTIATRRKVRFRTDLLNSDPPASSSPTLLTALETSATKFHLSHTRMVSRAYHDSLFIAHRFPTAMLFIPCRHGISHRPDEFSSPDQIQKGVNTLANTLAILSTLPNSPDEL